MSKLEADDIARANALLHRHTKGYVLGSADRVFLFEMVGKMARRIEELEEQCE